MSLSKTAAAAKKAVERGQQQDKEIWTPERTIKNIRQLREAHLAVPIDQIDVLLAEYDFVRKQWADSEYKRTGQLDIVRELEQENDEEDAFLANDYGGLGWEKDPQVQAIRKVILKYKETIKEQKARIRELYGDEA